MLILLLVILLDPSFDEPTTREKACLRELSVPPPLTYLFSTGPLIIYWPGFFVLLIRAVELQDMRKHNISYIIYDGLNVWADFI